MKLLIAVPVTDYMHYTFTECLLRLCRHLDMRGDAYEVKFHGGTLVHLAREDLAKYAMAGDFSHVLWLDADMIFPETVAEDLQRAGAPFVSAVYHARRPPHNSCVFLSVIPVRRPKEYPAEPFDIEGCGFGCCLMTVDVLRTVAAKHRLFLPDGYVGEDLTFCLQAKALGVRILCDPRVVCGHIGHEAVWPEGLDHGWRNAP